jgi:hypothetical protein
MLPYFGSVRPVEAPVVPSSPRVNGRINKGQFTNIVSPARGRLFLAEPKGHLL